MSATTTAQTEAPLRRRLRVLERAQSLSTLNGMKASDINILPLGVKHENPADDQGPSTATEYESRSESSEEEGEHSNAEGRDLEEEVTGVEDSGGQSSEPSTKRPKVAVDTAGVHRSTSRKERSPMSPGTRAWYEFDLAVVVALVSPIGNWLTGGDHIKNLLLIVLLIFYLHQIIEIPWKLYQQSRPRHRPLQMPPIDPDSPEGRYAQLAASELQRLETFFLFLTFLSPILGATLLRYATATVLGDDAMSWFSTGLFILATGVRPWAHVVDRLNHRTTELHDFVHYPSATHAVSEDEHQQLAERVAKLEKSLGKVKAKVAHTSEDVYEYVDDAVDAVEHAMRKQERKWDKYEGKVKEVEQAVGQLRSTKTPSPLQVDVGSAKAYLHTVMAYIFPSYHHPPRKSLSPTSNFRMPMRPLSGPPSPISSSSTPLETIVEEDYEGERYPILAQPSPIASGLVYRAGYVATMPLRAVARMVLRHY